MSEWPLEWRDVIDEAKNRRVEEGLSQRALAELAGVSAPTVGAFESGSINLNFANVAAILEALGMFVPPGEPDSLTSFVHRARRRWNDLVSELPADAPSRQPDGHYEQAYALRTVEPAPSMRWLQHRLAGAPSYSGWPPFMVLTRGGLRPTIEDRVVECWLGDPEVERVFTDAASSDFWQVSRLGTAYLQRGYQEDGRDLEPGTIFDLTLPIWRTAEVLRHAAWLAEQLNGAAGTPIRFIARYTGLAGRQLTPWAKRGMGNLMMDYRSRTETVDLVHNTTVGEINDDIGSVLLATLSPLYDRFGGFELPSRLVVAQLEDMTRAR